MTGKQCIAYFLLAGFFLLLTPGYGQDSVKRRSIDITSTFKPSLIVQPKRLFTASAAPTDSMRPRLSYTVPVQSLRFGFAPVPLRPLAYQADTPAAAKAHAYLKLGYGNFQAPYLRGFLPYGKTSRYNGNLEVWHQSARGKLEKQQFDHTGAQTNLGIHLANKSTLRLKAAVQSDGYWRYGGELKQTIPPDDSIRLRYTDVSVGAALANTLSEENKVGYSARLDAHFFADNNSATETALHFDFPISKTISDHASLTLGIQGMASAFSADTASFSNNLFTIPVRAQLQLNENMWLRAGLIPSWNNDEFKLVPDAHFEYLWNEKNMVFQAGFHGYFAENNFRTLARVNPWIAQPTAITNTRNSDLYVGLKMNVNDVLNFRARVGGGNQHHVPLYVNDASTGRNFEVVFEESLTRFFLSGEVNVVKGQRLNWSTSLQFNSFTNLKDNPKAYGLLPYELRSSLGLQIIEDLRLTVDLYNFNGAWYRKLSSESKKGNSVIDLNAGLEFDLHRNLRLWVQFNNLTNSKYERWHTYEVLGFQARGGIIFHL